MENRIKEVMASVLGLEVSRIDGSTSPQTVEGWDSLKSINLVIALEEEFQVKFSDEDIMNMLDYKTIYLTIKEMLMKARGEW